jgi:hypothetical protein
VYERVQKIEEIYARTKNKVKLGEKEGEWFETTEGKETGLPAQPPAIYDICGRYRRNVKESASEGSVVGREKIWSLAFADDLVRNM